MTSKLTGGKLGINLLSGTPVSWLTPTRGVKAVLKTYERQTYPAVVGTKEVAPEGEKREDDSRTPSWRNDG